jgi:uncharacterized protein YyaL (SSP411 family)
MIAACAQAGRVLERGSGYIETARRAAAFIRAHLWNDGDGTLLRRFRNGDAAVPGYAEDYAYLIFGLLELFQADGDPAWLEWALTLQQRLDELFWDPVGGGWFSTTGSDASVLLRLKEEYDGAEPAASSVAVLNLLSISHLTGDATMAEKVERTFGAFGGSMSGGGRGLPMMLSALSTHYIGIPQVMIVGGPERSDASGLWSVVRRHYLPTAVVAFIDESHRQVLSRLLPWTEPLRARDGRATAYLCREFACEVPATSADELENQLVNRH